MKSTNKFEILKLFLIAALFIITPLLSSSVRSTYLYLIVNILVLIVVAEAGLLSLFSNSPANYNRPHSIISELSPDDKLENTVAPQRIEKCSSEKIAGEERKAMVIKKSPSTPSIFFIDGCDDEGEEIGEVNGQELFQKAETFIGNFYKQLKMQREESWKSLHDIYRKAF